MGSSGGWRDRGVAAIVAPPHRSRLQTAVRSPAWTSVGVVLPHSAVRNPRSGGQRVGLATGRVSRMRTATTNPDAAGQDGHHEDRDPRVEAVREHPDEDRPDREPEVAPEAVDTRDCAPRWRGSATSATTAMSVG